MKTPLKLGPVGPNTEYMPEPDSERLAATLVAFANADGGTILLGLHPDGSAAEGLFGEEVEGALRGALLQCRPPLRTEWAQLETPGGTIAAIHVPRPPALPPLDDGRGRSRSAEGIERCVNAMGVPPGRPRAGRRCRALRRRRAAARLLFLLLQRRLVQGLTAGAVT